MKQQEVTASLEGITVNVGDTRDLRALGGIAEVPAKMAASVTYQFLTNLIFKPGTGFIARQILRTVRGLVANAMRGLGMTVPADPR